MNKYISISIIIYIIIIVPRFAMGQFRWSAEVGGGYSDLEIPFNGKYDYYELLKGNVLVEAGTSLSNVFSREGLLGWQINLMVQYDGFRSIPIDDEEYRRMQEELRENVEPGDPIIIDDLNDIIPPRDNENVFKQHNWSLNVPVSFTFNAFEVVGLLAGADFHLTLNRFDKANQWKINTRGDLTPEFKYFNIGAHLGLFIPVTDRLRIDLRVFSDVKPRLGYFRDSGGSIRDYRRVGTALNVSYTLNEW